MPGGERYRLVVEGELTADRALWLGAQGVVVEGGRTRMVIRVAGQSELHGLLRRIRDVNLRIIEVTHIGNGNSAGGAS